LRRFELHRDLDVSGISGEGVIADGVVYDHPFVVTLPERPLVLEPGWCVITWRGEHCSTALWRSVDDAMAIHGHHGATRLVWKPEPAVAHR
jgi:hypothetical protein